MKHIDLRIASRTTVTLQLEGNQARRGPIQVERHTERERERESTI